jgi:hypothetical protein
MSAEAIHVWPGLSPNGTSVTVYAEDGVTPIQAGGGAIVPYAPYYRELLASAQLLTYNPLETSGESINLVTSPLQVTGTPSAGNTIEATGPNTAVWSAPSAASTWLNTMASLAATPGTISRQLRMIVGHTIAGDGGEGLFYWDATSAEASNGGTILGAFPLGRWKRVFDRSVVHVDWFGAPHDSVADALPAFNQALGLVPVGGTLRLGPYTYVIHGKWLLQPGKTIEGYVGDSGGLYGGTIVRYLGPTDQTELGCAIDAQQYSTLKDFRLEIGAGRKCRAGICVASSLWTSITFENIGVGCWANSSSYFEHGYVVGATTTPGGCDTIRWVRGYIYDFAVSALHIGGGQPYDLVFREVNFLNQIAGYLGSIGGAIAHGAILTTSGTYFGNIAFENPNIGYVAVFIDSSLGGMANVSIIGGQWEGGKRIWNGVGKDVNAACVFSIEGGRYNTTQLDKPVYRVDGVTLHIAASDRRLIASEQGSPITMRNLHLGAGLSSAVDNTATFEIREPASFTADGCIFPNPNILSRVNEFDYPSGGTYIRGCKAYTPADGRGVIISTIDEHHGPENPDFFWTADGDVMGASATATVTLPKPEIGSGMLVASGGFTNYMVFMHPYSSTGTPPDGAFVTRVVAGSVRGVSFGVELGAPPGAGNTVTFSVSLQLVPYEPWP